MSHLEPVKPGAARVVAAALVVLLVLIGGALWWTGRDDATTSAQDAPSPSVVEGPSPGSGPSATPGAASSGPRATVSDAATSSVPSDRPGRPALPKDARVVVVSIDGLASYAVTAAQMPVLTGLLADGAGTLNARTEVEMTVTLPNHTGMVTGRRIDAAAGGHGVTWNEETPRTVRPGVDSVFTVIDEAGGQSAVFTGKEKFRMWNRSWPGQIDRFEVDADLASLTRDVVADLEQTRRDLVFFHVAAPDVAGHASGWDSRAYDDAVRLADAALGEVVRTIWSDRARARQTILIVTADHGGLRGEKGHSVATSPQDYTIPFVVWGRGVAHDDLYRLNPDYRDPGQGRPSYAGSQPVRNGAVANLTLDLLGLPAVPGSQIDAAQDLDVN